jgi:multidrug efflux pump subunit AcrA (membrane-fusion protein)
VRAQAVDGATVVITDGLKPGQRVVVQGAALVNQVR